MIRITLPETNSKFAPEKMPGPIHFQVRVVGFGEGRLKQRLSLNIVTWFYYALRYISVICFKRALSPGQPERVPRPELASREVDVVFFFFGGGGRQGSLNYPFWENQTIQIYGNFEGFPL